MSDEKPFTQRIIRALKNEPKIVGRYDLLKSCVPSGQWSLEDTSDLNWAVTALIEQGRITEEQVQIEGTGHEGPPVYEYVYRIVKDTKK